MLCFMDRTFCPGEFYRKCIHKDNCSRPLTPFYMGRAIRWWGPKNGVPPIVLFTDKPKCFGDRSVKIRPA